MLEIVQFVSNILKTREFVRQSCLENLCVVSHFSHQAEMAWGCKISKHHGFDTDYIDVEWRCAAFYNITGHFWKVKSVHIPLLIRSVVLFSVTYRILLSSCVPKKTILWENKTKWYSITSTNQNEERRWSCWKEDVCVCVYLSYCGVYFGFHLQKFMPLAQSKRISNMTFLS